MIYLILNILCEGQTEERFVKEVLSPYFHQFQVFPKPVLLVTSKKKNARGGMLSYSQAKHDLCTLIKQCKNTANKIHLFTTMFDYYALPEDFPGFDEAKKFTDIRQRISTLETEFKRDIDCNSFIPYIQLHEFEALLFTDIHKLAAYYPLSSNKIAKLKVETDIYEDPELINNSPMTAPSKRIIKAVQNEYHYNKVQSGAAVTKDIGLDSIISRCLHFKEWIERILILKKIVIQQKKNKEDENK